MKRFIYYIIILTFCCCESFAQSLYHDFNNGNISADELIAKVGPINITAEEFFYNYEFGPTFTKKDPNSKTIHLKYMIQEKLIGLEAVDQGKINSITVENVHEDIVGDLATEELFKDEIVELIKIDSNDISKAIEEKSVEIDLKWLYTSKKKDAENIHLLLENGASFDSLFNIQLNDSVYSDERSLKISLFDLRKKNYKLYRLYDSLKLQDFSKPIAVEKGWYIIRLVNQTKSLIQTQSEYDQNYTKSLYGLTKIKMDSLSDLYVNNLMISNKPIIKRDAFNVIRSYIGKFILDSSTFNDWELLDKMESAQKNIGIKNISSYNNIILVETTEDNFTLEHFINWYRNRELHLKFDKANLIQFSKSLENMIWRMVRDKLLIAEAKEKKYYENSWVKKQSTWWKDKITYSVFRNELLNSFEVENYERINKDNTNLMDENIDVEYNQKIFRVLTSAKRKYPVTINFENLDKINVSVENSQHAIDLYTAKNSGLLPRPAYPSIDNEWAKWQ